MPSLPSHKTKIICTIGPASDSPEMLRKMIRSGMNIARLNFSHGDFSGHGTVISRLREAAQECGQQLAIMADLPGPKMRIGRLAAEPLYLRRGHRLTLTGEPGAQGPERISTSMPSLADALSAGDTIFLNDGLIQLQVEEIKGSDICCRVVVGGELRSRKGMNIPGIELGESAFTPRDRECLEYALSKGVDAVSQSFVSRAQDVEDLRTAAAELGHAPFIIAKIERRLSPERIDDILMASDGIMVARGDLGVEIPIEEIAMAQKAITTQANRHGKPVITATQMLESMTRNRRPTRAEATDVANAILDGTDCVMLSEESALGDFPLEAVAMLAKIAAATEPFLLENYQLKCQEKCSHPSHTIDLKAMSIMSLLNSAEAKPAAILTPTDSGYTARSMTRLRPPVWILAVSPFKKTCQELLFSHGVWPILVDSRDQDWNELAQSYVKELGLAGRYLLRTEGPSPDHPEANHKVEMIKVSNE
ncbi:MAG: pyruvate kinase [Thermodesulfobacteriota bacterium]